VSANGVLSDARSTRFGIRDLQWVRTESAPTNYINRYQLGHQRTRGADDRHGTDPPWGLAARVSEHNLQLLHQAKAPALLYLIIVCNVSCQMWH